MRIDQLARTELIEKKRAAVAGVLRLVRPKQARPLFPPKVGFQVGPESGRKTVR
jgi:hypothetical protein